MSDTANTPSPRGRNDLIAAPSSYLRADPSRNGASKHDGANHGITVRFVLHAMRQWWKVAVPTGLVLAAISGAVVYLLFEPQYEARAWFQIESNTPYIAFPKRSDSGLFVQTQVQLIHSPLVMGPAVSRPEIACLPEVERQSAPIEWLSRKIQVLSQGRSELFTISFVGPSAVNAAAIVGAVTDSYFKLRGVRDAERRLKVIDLLNEERVRREKEVERLRGSVRQLAKEVTGMDPYAAESNKGTTVLRQLADLQGRLTTVEVAREILDAEIKAFEGTQQEPMEVEEALIEKALEEHAEIKGLEALISAKQARLREYKEKLLKGTQDPTYQRLSKEVQGDKARLARARVELRDEVKEEMEQTIQNRRDSDLAQMRRRRDGYRTMENWLRGKCEEVRKSVVLGAGSTLELQFMKAELARAEDVQERIARRVLELVTEERAPRRVTLLQEAVVPTGPVEQLPYKWITLALLGSLCLPFALAVVWERVVQRVNDSVQLEQHSSLPVVGEVARLPSRRPALRGSASGRGDKGGSVFEESIDSLRTSLVLSEPLKHMRVLVVTSAANNEGKTSVSVQLAVSIARASGELVLLIDGDMRSPDLHNLLETPLEPGLAQVLARECTLEDALVKNWSKHVHLLPAGKPDASPHKLLGNGVLKPLLEEAQAAYRYIIIDTPPVLAASEALVLAQAADVSLICAMRDVSRIDQVKRTHKRLELANGNPVGVVLNGIPTKAYAYRYGSYGYLRG